MKKFFHYLVLVCLLVGSSAIGFIAHSQDTTTSTGPLVPFVTTTPIFINDTTQAATEDIVKQAGFTGVSIQPQSGKKYEPPVVYFKVNETSADPKTKNAWGADANTVAVLVKKMWSKEWAFNNGEMAFNNIDGHTQVKLSSPGYYFVVTGPDSDKVAALAQKLAQLNHN